MSPSWEDEFYYHADLGDSFSETQEIENAISEYRQALATPGDHDKSDVELILYKLASSLRQQQQWGKSIETCYRLLAMNPDESMAYQLLGDIYSVQNQFDQAISSYRKAIAIDNNLVDAYHNLAMVLKQTEQYDEAISMYQKALEIAPDEPDIHYSLGNVYRRIDRLEDAIAEYQIAIQLKFDYADALNNLALTLIDLGQFEEAANAALRGLDFAPGDNDLQLNLEDALNELEDISHKRF